MTLADRTLAPFEFKQRRQRKLSVGQVPVSGPKSRRILNGAQGLALPRVKSSEAKSCSLRTLSTPRDNSPINNPATIGQMGLQTGVGQAHRSRPTSTYAANPPWADKMAYFEATLNNLFRRRWPWEGPIWGRRSAGVHRSPTCR